MKLTVQQINKFQKVYHQEFGEDIDFDKARRELSKLVDLTQLIYRPLKKCEIKKES
jgi:hypothetical protein